VPEALQLLAVKRPQPNDRLTRPRAGDNGPPLVGAEESGPPFCLIGIVRCDRDIPTKVHLGETKPKIKVAILSQGANRLETDLLADEIDECDREAVLRHRPEFGDNARCIAVAINDFRNASPRVRKNALLEGCSKFRV